MAATEILLLRHAEKPKGADGRHGFTPEGQEDGKSLSIRGWQRAGALAALLAPNPLLDPRLPRPDRIYASVFRKGVATAAGRSRPCCRSRRGWVWPWT
jgi:broad specificity phosphatase PhoE